MPLLRFFCVVCLILVNTISEEHLEGIQSNLLQMSTWTLIRFCWSKVTVTSQNRVLVVTQGFLHIFDIQFLVTYIHIYVHQYQYILNKLISANIIYWYNSTKHTTNYWQKKSPVFWFWLPDRHSCFYMIGEESGRRGPVQPLWSSPAAEYSGLHAWCVSLTVLLLNFSGEAK